MAHGDRRKCMCCKKLFRPDPRNRRHQSYCSAPTCKAASKTASQAPPRVKAWRSRHPSYWREDRRSGSALQENSMAQPADSTVKTGETANSPLQDVLTAQPAVLIGLIAHIVGTPLQDDIVRATGRLLRLGQHILSSSAARAATPPPDCGGGRDRLRDVLQDPRLP